MLGSIQSSHLRWTPYLWILGLQWNERKRCLCTVYAVPLMRIMIQREWRKELGLPVTLNAADFDSRFLSAFSMVPSFEEFFRDFNQFKWKRLKKDEVWALRGVIWTGIEWNMAKRKIGGEGFRERERLQVSEFEIWIYRWVKCTSWARVMWMRCIEIGITW